MKTNRTYSIHVFLLLAGVLGFSWFEGSFQVYGEAQAKSFYEHKPQLIQAVEPEESETSLLDLPESDPGFDSFEALLAYFDPYRGKLQTSFEEIERSRIPETEELQRYQEAHQTLDKRIHRALQSYISQHPKAEDLGIARHERVMISSKLGHWNDVLVEAQSFLEHHRQENQDLSREVLYLKADAFFSLVGREAEAAEAFKSMIETYPQSFEADLSRAKLLQTYLYLDKVEHAHELLQSMQELEHVVQDQGASEFIVTQKANLSKVGQELPNFQWLTLEDQELTRISIVGQPLLFWYWDSNSAPSLGEEPLIQKLAEEWQDKLKVYMVSVNQNKNVWKQYVTQHPQDHAIHVFEGRDAPETSAKQLGIQVLPTSVLIDQEGKVYRFDLPLPQLERTLKLWLSAK